MKLKYPKKCIESLIDGVWESTHSDFYRTIWKNAGIEGKPDASDLESFNAIPTIDRATLASYEDPGSRLYGELNAMDTLTTTSGTTGDSMLLFWHKIPIESTRLVPYAQNEPTKLMSFNAHHKYLIHAIRGRYAGMEVLAGDVHNMLYSAELAKVAGTNTLYITPSLANIFAEFLDSYQYVDSISTIVLWGEYCPDSLYDDLKTKYKNARFIFEYSSTEADHIAYATSECDAPHQVKHIDTKAHYVEIIDDEVVLTTLQSDRVNPLLRYRTGDKAEWVDSRCSCGDHNPQMELLGRVDGSSIRIAGGEIKVSELDKAMEVFDVFIEPTFWLEVKQNDKGTLLTLHIQKRDNVTLPEETLRERISFEFPDTFRISTSLTLKNALENNMIDSFSVKLTKKVSVTEKHNKLVTT